MIIIACILLFISSLTATIGAADAMSSSEFSTSPQLRFSQRYLSISAALGWIALIILFILLIIGALIGAFTLNAMEVPTVFTQNNVNLVEDEIEQLNATYASQYLIMVLLMVLTIITTISAILSIIATVNASQVDSKDNHADATYTLAFISAMTGSINSFIMLTAYFAYYNIRSVRDFKLQKLDSYIAGSHDVIMMQ
jgi:hypothetical protein